jgi:hypothetical protein
VQLGLYGSGHLSINRSVMTDFAQRLHQREDQFRDLNGKIQELRWVDSQYRQAGAEQDRLTKVVNKLKAELEELKKIRYVAG